MHYFIIAGEASGDLHAAHLIEALKANDPQAIITFLGGDKMAAAAGGKPLIHYKHMAFMGFSEVLRNLRTIGNNLTRAKQSLRLASPDCLILVDYPSFNLKMAAEARKLDIPVYYYISPKIWAWKKWRIADIKRSVRKMLCILPFEPDFYRENDFDATYVGNPSVAEIDADMASAPPRQEFLERHRLRDRPLVAIMPGSRRGEIRNNLPMMRAAIHAFPQYRGIIVGAPGIPDEFYDEYAGTLPLVREHAAAHILAHCRAAIVTSGTATLETALANIPQVVCYRANGMKLTYEVMKRILNVVHVSLPNLIAAKTIVPELLLHLCTPQSIALTLAPLLRDTPERRAQLDGYELMRKKLGTDDAAAGAASIIIKDLRGQ